MTATPFDEENYRVFVETQVARLGALDIKDDAVVWHYTSGEALLGIIETGTMFATQVSCLNDSTEINYSTRLLVGAFQDLLSSGAGGEESSRLIAAIISNYETAGLNNLPSPWFVCCFSSNGDDLSQWRAYAGGENGYAIGLLARNLFGKRGNIVVKVNYDATLHESIAKSVGQRTLELFQNDLGLGRVNSAEDWLKVFGSKWAGWLDRLAPMVKNHAFSSEHEYRVIHQLSSDELPSVRLRQKPTLMSRYLPLVFPGSPAVRSRQLPITHIRVGPGRHKEISRASVEVFLSQNGYSEVPVSISEVPFQQT